MGTKCKPIWLAVRGQGHMIKGHQKGVGLRNTWIRIKCVHKEDIANIAWWLWYRWHQGNNRNQTFSSETAKLNLFKYNSLTFNALTLITKSYKILIFSFHFSCSISFFVRREFFLLVDCSSTAPSLARRKLFARILKELVVRHSFVSPEWTFEA